MNEIYADFTRTTGTQTVYDQQETQLALLNEAGLIATQLLDLQHILDFTLDFMNNKIGMSATTIYLWSDQEQRYTLQASRGLSQKQIKEIDRRRLAGPDITQEVIDTGKEVFIHDMGTDSRFIGIWDRLDNRSYVKLPMISRNTVVGVLGLLTHVNQPLESTDVHFVKAIGREIGIAIDNARLIAEAKLQENQAKTLYNIGTRISSSLSLRVVLDAVAEAAKELIDVDLSLVGLLDEQSKQIVYQSASGLRKTLSPQMRLTINNHPDWQHLIEKKPLIINNLDRQDRHILHDPDFIKTENIHSILTVPLHRVGTFIGTIEVFSRNDRIFNKNDSWLLSRLSSQVLVAIENAQLYHQLRQLAVLEERDLIARGLHDHLAQGLGYIKVKASIAEDLLSNGAIDETKSCLQELIKTTQILYTDVREEIFNLRQEVEKQENFFETLDEYLCEYMKYYNLNVDLLIKRNCICDIPSNISNQLLRIIQEAMTNIRRHANASSAYVTCNLEDDFFQVTIEDNGQGFNLDEIDRDKRQHFGLSIMRERVENMGGEFELKAIPDKGTTILVRVPARLIQ